jgi:ribose transport system ATP-binding protein
VSSPDRFAPQPLLEMQGISKAFQATRALDDVCLSVNAGQVLALIGENGAGKSTLMKVLSGVYQPDAGSMSLAGLPFQPARPGDARRAGIAMIYQELNLAPDLSVEENVLLGIEEHRLGFVRKSRHRNRVREALSVLGHANLPLDVPVGRLSVGTQQVVEIARGLVSDARVMIFDEPTSSLSSHDVNRLFDILQRLRQKGLAVIYISHFLEEVRRVADHYVVLRDGKSVAQGPLSDPTDQQLVELMIGRSVANLFPGVPHSPGEPVLDVKQLSGRNSPRSISFTLRRGEIMGLFGLIGAGRTETLRCLLGLDRSTEGSATSRGKPLQGSPRARIRSGLGLVSEDRKTEGLAQSMSIADNLTLSALSRYASGGLLQLKQRHRAVVEWMAKLSVKAQGPEQSISQLSGGNQQKVAIARLLHQDAEILLLDEPTRGIDVGTKAEIYRLMGETAAQGKSILFVSSYLPELLAVCDTVGVMSRGKLREIRPAAEWTESSVMSVAVSTDNDLEDERL